MLQWIDADQKKSKAYAMKIEIQQFYFMKSFPFNSA